MATESQKLNCVFTLRDGTAHEGMAHLFWHDYGERTFWYGVAQLTEMPRSGLGSETLAGRLTFEDGRSGGISILDGKLMSGGYYEIGFVGLTKLVRKNRVDS